MAEPEDVTNARELMLDLLAACRRRYRWWRAKRPHWYQHQGRCYR